MATVDNLNLKISADSKKAVASLDELIDKVNRLNSALNSINTNGISQIGKASKRTNPSNGSSGTGANTLDKDKRKYDGFFKTITSGSDKAGLSFNRLGDKVFRLASTFGMFYAAAYPFIRLMKSFGTQTENAMDYVETFNYYRVSMNKIARDSGEEAAEGFATSFEKRVNDLTQKMTGFKIGTNGELFDANDKSLGLDPNLLMNFQARIGAVTNSVGLLGDTSIATQKALSMLSADLSSLTNTDLESVMGNLQSGLIGQSRALYKYGLDITNATLQTYALENGVTKAVSSMTQAEKMQLRLLAILDQSKVAWGDQANTLGSVANQYRILQQQISNLGRVIGNLFLPIVQKVLPYINAMVIALRKLLTIFGFNLFGNNWLKDIMDGISSGSSGAVDGMEDFADAEDEATKNAKKLQNATMGFDELNIISDNSSSGGKGSGGSDFDLGGAIQDALEDYEKVWDEAFKNAENKAEELANRIVSAFKRGGFEGLGKFISDSLTKALQKINWNKVYSGASKFGKGLADFLNGLISPELFFELGRTIAGSINIAILTYKEFWTNFRGSNLGLSIANGINGFFKEIKAKELAEGMNAFVDTITEALIEAITNIDWKTILSKIGEFIYALDTDTIILFVGAFAIKKFGKSLGAAILSKIAFDDAFVGRSVGDSLSAILSKHSITLKSAIKVTAGIALTLEGIKNVVKGLDSNDWQKRMIGEIQSVIGATVLFGANGFVATVPLIITFELGLKIGEAINNSQAMKDKVDKMGAESTDMLSSSSASGNLDMKIFQILFGGNKETVESTAKDVGKSIGTNVSAGIQEGMVSNTKETSNSTSKSLLDMIKESLKIAFGIHSPATSMYDIGENIFLGVIEGMKNSSFDVEAIKTKISEGWNSVLEWWNNTALVQWWENFKQNFSVEKISENIGSFVEGFTPKWSEVESWWNDTVMPSVDGANESFGEKMDEISEKISGTLDTIKTDGKEKINALIGGFEGFINKIISGINSFIGLLNGMIASAVANINTILAYMKLPPITVKAIATLTEVSIPRLAVGGQVDEGQLFIAREAGPELVGSMGGKTTVANNDQIVEGIQSGVRAAVAEVLAPYLREIANNTRETADKDFSFSITDRDIARANISGQRSLGMTLRTS